jgi:hypothetical protein
MFTKRISSHWSCSYLIPSAVDGWRSLRGDTSVILSYVIFEPCFTVATLTGLINFIAAPGVSCQYVNLNNKKRSGLDIVRNAPDAEC